MRRIAVAIIVAIASMLQPVAASAATNAAAERTKAPPIADRDGNRISDDLDRMLARAAADEPVDVIVTWNGPVRAGDVQRAVGAFDVGQEYEIIDGFSATMRARQARAIAGQPGVFRVERDVQMQTTIYEASADYGGPYARSTFGLDGSGVGVCVIDTGADPNHEQLDAGKIVAWNDWVNGGANPYDDHGHGTHVAAIAVGDGVGGSNAAHHKGLAPGASAYVAKVLDGFGFGSMSNVIAGIQWCNGFEGVDVISLSLGEAGPSDGQDAASQAVDAAVANGDVVVVAAGNAGDEPDTLGSPAGAEGAITVGASGDSSSGGFYLAHFSSRGPTTDGRIKPDIVAPGVGITAASAGSTAGYVSFDGTSMATPHVSGLVALALEHGPMRTPAEIKSLIASTARDAGAAGKDPEYGWGFIDGYTFIAEAGGASGYPPFPMPTHRMEQGTVPNSGQWTHTFTLGPDDLNVPIGATMIIDGSLRCAYRLWGSCWAWEWSPDLDIELRGPAGNVIASSTCAAGVECYRGRTETIHAAPAGAGTYTWRVWAAQDDVNKGRGGTFRLDWWTGPRVGPGSPPPPPSNDPPVADAGPDQTVVDADDSGSEPVTLDGSGSSDLDGTIVSYDWADAGGPLATGVSPTIDLTVGTHTITLTVTDDDGATDTDEVVVTVDPAPSPPPPGGTVHVGDLDGSAVGDKKTWTATVTILLHDAGEGPVGGATVSGTWSDGTPGSCETNAFSTCDVSLGGLAKRDKSATFTVGSVVAGGLTYDASSNHDPDGDSDGTAITVTRG